MDSDSPGDGRPTGTRDSGAEGAGPDKARLERLVSQSPDAFFEVTLPDMRCAYISPQVESLTGYTPQSFYSDPALFQRIIEPQHLPAVRAACEELAGSGRPQSVQCSIRHESGSIRWLRCNAALVIDDANRSVAIAGRVADVTEHKRLHDALLEAEQRFSRTFRTTPLPSTITSFDGRYLDVSDTFCEMTGYTREDVIGKSSVDLDIWADPADRERMIQMFKERGACSGLEVKFRLKDSSIVIVELSAGIIRIDDRPVIFSVTQDLTAQRHAEEERRRMETHVARVQRLESLGVLAGGIAHDFNNMLAVIAGNSALASRHLTASGPEMALRCLEEIERAAMQARHLTQQLLTFARGGAPQREIFALGPLLREAAGFALAGSQHRCVFEVPDDLWAVDADSGQIGQVLHNLVLNAAQAMQEPGTIQVQAVHVTEPEQQVERWVKVSVVDSGPGVPPEIAPHIFDPFFTTKERGNGLGLATAHSIVVAHGGRLELTPSGRSGSTFSFWIPAAVSDARVEPSATRSEKLERKLHILLLDDQPALIRVMKSGLEAEGHRVRGTKDSSEAVEDYRAALERGDRFDVVVMDLTIPGSMGGAAALEQIKELDPTVVAIAASGYSNDPVMSDYAAYGFAGRLPKPFRQAELTSAIAAALERRR